MPKIIEQNIFVELPKKAYKIYDELEKDLFTRIEDRSITAANTAVASGKCRQVASGALYLDSMDDDGVATSGKKEWVDLHNQKLDAVEELMGELQGSSLIIAYDFKHDLARLLKRLGKDTPYIGGGVSIKKSKAIEDAWNAGELPVLLGQPQSIAHGLNLQKGSAHHICWFTLTWNYEHYDQFIRRLRRQGNKALRVFVYHILARGTVDEAVLLSLQRKEGGQMALFNALKEYQMKKRGY
jgi:SNF2 family DNA or RNA helicase